MGLAVDKLGCRMMVGMPRNLNYPALNGVAVSDNRRRGYNLHARAGGFPNQKSRGWSLSCGRRKQKSAEFEHETMSAWLNWLMIPLDRESCLLRSILLSRSRGSRTDTKVALEPVTQIIL